VKHPVPLAFRIARVASTLVALLCAVGVSAAAAAAEYALTRDGRPTCAIVVATAPSEAAQFAAFELQETLRIITGATVPIVNDRQTVTGTKIFVGESEATRALGLKSADFSPQESLVRFLPEAVVLIGRDRPYRGVKVDYADFKTYPDIWSDMATCHAVYDFLEKHCGVRWYAPGELGTVCDARPTLAVTVPVQQEERRKPRMTYRECEIGGNYAHDNVRLTGEDTVSGAEWNRFLRRLRLGGEKFMVGHSTGSLYFYHWAKIRSNHQWSTAAPMKDWFQGRRPELFAKGYEKDPVAWSGMRGWFAPEDNPPPQPCLSAPGILEFFAARATDYFASNDTSSRWFQGLWIGGPFFPFHWDDNNWFCKCPECRSQIHDDILLQDGKGNGRFSTGYASTYYFNFVNKLAREVAKDRPEKFIGTLAYWQTAHHPGFELEPNVAVQLAISPRNFWCPATRLNETDIYNEWIERERGKRPLYLWLYYCFPVMSGHSLKFTEFPAFFTRQLAADWKRYAADGIRGYFIQSSWAFPGKFFHDQLELHLASKLSDDPTLDGEKLIDEFFTRYYGAAAQPMRAFYELIEKTCYDPTNYPEGIRSGALELHQSEEIAWKWLGTPARMAELSTLMEKAKAAVRTETEKQRVALFERGIWLPMVQGAAKYAGKAAPAAAVEEMKKRPAPTVAVPRLEAPGKGAAANHAAERVGQLTPE
jgi:hypothetical protein